MWTGTIIVFFLGEVRTKVNSSSMMSSELGSLGYQMDATDVEGVSIFAIVTGVCMG